MADPTQPPPPTVSAAQLVALIALIEAQAKVRRQFTDAATAAAVAAFEALTDWWDDAKVAKAVAAALRVVQPNQRQAARVTAAYLARAASVMSGRTVAPTGAVDITRLRRKMPDRVAQALVDGGLEPGWLVLGEHDPENRRTIATAEIDDPVAMVVPDPGETVMERIRRRRAEEAAAEAAPPAAPYERIAEKYRFQVVAKGSTNERARRYALVRVAEVVDTDITLAVREQYRTSMGKLRGVTGWRRILHPELSESGPCGLCVVAADRVYRVQDLKPIHGRCVCEALPIIGALDPGLHLNRRDLDAIYEVGGSKGGSKREQGALKKIRVALAEHGELGPVLVDADQHYRGPKKVAALVVPDLQTRLLAQLRSLDESYALLLHRRAAGEDVDRPLEWQANRIDQLRHQLAGVA